MMTRTNGAARITMRQRKGPRKLLFDNGQTGCASAHMNCFWKIFIFFRLARAHFQTLPSLIDRKLVRGVSSGFPGFDKMFPGPIPSAD